MTYKASSSNNLVVEYDTDKVTAPALDPDTNQWTVDVTLLSLTYPISYQFYLTVQNEHGEVSYSPLISVTVSFDCTGEQILQKTSMPSDEDILNDPSKSDFVLVEDIPVVVVRNQIGTKLAYTVELRSRFTSTAPNFCQITLIQISKVLQKATGNEIEYSTLFTYDDLTGLFSILEFDTIYTNYLVYFKAQTGSISTDFAPSDESEGRPMLDITFEPIPVEEFVPNFEPDFIEEPESFEVNILESQKRVFSLPQLFDINPEDSYSYRVDKGSLYKFVTIQESIVNEQSQIQLVFDPLMMDGLEIGQHSIKILAID